MNNNDYYGDEGSDVQFVEDLLKELRWLVARLELMSDGDDTALQAETAAKAAEAAGEVEQQYRRIGLRRAAGEKHRKRGRAENGHGP